MSFNTVSITFYPLHSGFSNRGEDTRRSLSWCRTDYNSAARQTWSWRRTDYYSGEWRRTDYNSAARRRWSGPIVT